MEKRWTRRCRMALSSRTDHNRRPAHSSRVRSRSLPPRWQSVRCLRTRTAHTHHPKSPAHIESLRHILRRKRPLHGHRHLRLHQTVRRQMGRKGQTTELAPLMVHGTAWFRIKDPNLFVNEVVGGQGAYSTPQVDDFIRGFINERVIDVMSKYDLTTAFTQLDKASTDVKVNINDALNRLGTDLVYFKFEGIDTSDQFRDRLFWIKQRAATSDVLRMETAKDIGASLGASQGGGAGLGAGMVLIPQVMGAQMQQPMMQPQAQVTVVTCPNCGNTMTPPQAATSPCPNCGKPVTVGAKFCPECGRKI